MLDPIHPFPARMAPEIAFEFLEDIKPNSTVLDPMCGSGVVLRSAVEKSHRCVGNDADPLSVMMSQVWIKNSKHSKLPIYAEKIVESAYRHRKLDIPWHKDDETKQFVEFWFGKKQRDDLARLSLAIYRQRATLPSYAVRALYIALSRTIITKTRGASLAWDVSHSRPHKKKLPNENDYDVIEGFLLASKLLARKLNNNEEKWSGTVKRGDTRKLSIPTNSIDAIITSPPYLNAIDYMRGHRLSLVWIGYSIPVLRGIRTAAIGTETSHRPPEAKKFIKSNFIKPMPKAQRLTEQYLRDVGAFMRELRRVAKRNAPICIITANSKILGTDVNTNELIHAAAEGAGLSYLGEKVRKIEQKRRYLPVDTSNDALKSRMMEEHIQYFAARSL